MTVMLRVRKDRPSRKKIGLAAAVIRTGGLVAFPTETVYGLGADAFNGEAIKKIFQAKGRPRDNPLIVHIADLSALKTLAKSFPRKARLLCAAFWPGPLTVVVKKGDMVPQEVTAGAKTVAVRMPDHNVALSLIRAAGVPLVAPSANLSGRPSPTSAAHVRQDLSGHIDLIVDGGKTAIGMESTVVDFSGREPRILRPGAITAVDMETIIGPVIPYNPTAAVKSTPKSPGMKYRHYAPQTKLVLAPPDNYKDRIDRLISQAIKKNKKIAVISFNRQNRYSNCLRVYAGSRPQLVAHRLFHVFRHLDGLGLDLIIAEPYFRQDGWGIMINDRLKKAAGGRIGLDDEGSIP